MGTLCYRLSESMKFSKTVFLISYSTLEKNDKLTSLVFAYFHHYTDKYILSHILLFKKWFVYNCILN